MAGTKRRATSPHLPPAVVKRLAREYSDVLAGKHGVGYCSVEPDEPDNLSRWRGWLKGPPGSPYENGIFHVRFSVSDEYPFKPPGLLFETKIYHCECGNANVAWVNSPRARERRALLLLAGNIDSTGGVCLNLLKKEWSPSQTLFSVMQTLYVLLASPNPDDPLVPAIAKQYRADVSTHNRVAQEWTLRYASPAALADPTSGSGSSDSVSKESRGRLRKSGT
jgi:ubiquitin-protein ligase